MKREEAIFYIKELQKTYASMDKKVAEAINMAIEALQFQDIMINNPQMAKPTPVVCKNCQENNRPKGKWIKKYNGNGWNDCWDYECSNCGTKYERASAVLYDANFCPNCSADMTGGDME